MIGGYSLKRAISEFGLLAVVSTIWFLILFVRQAFPPLFATFQADFSISNTEVGFLFSVLMGTYAVTQFPSGVLSDRFGNLPIISLGTFLLSVGAVGFSVSPTFTLLAVAASVIGIGSGMHKTVAINLLSEEYAQHRGFALGLMDTVGQFGGVAAPLVVVALQTSTLPWSLLFVATAIVGSSLSFTIHGGYVSRSRPPPDEEHDAGLESPTKASYRQLLFDSRLLLFVIAASLLAFAWNALSAFLPLYLTHAKDLTPETASLIYSLFFGASLTQIVTGRLSDNVAYSTLMLGLVVVVLGGIAILVVGTGGIVIAIAVGVVGVGFHGLRPVRDSYFTVLLPDTIGGGGLGIIRTIMTVVGSIAPALFGLLSDRVGFGVAMMALGGVLLSCFVVLCYQRTK